MAVIFKPEDHSYTSIDPEENIDWISVTSFVNKFKNKFDSIAIAKKVTKNSKSKWYKMPVEQILESWENDSKRAIELGNWYHTQRESDLLSIDTIERSGVPIGIVKPIYKDNIKQAPDQNLIEGIYPEHFVYLKSAGICGQSDRVEVIKDHVDIIDYKTNKEIKQKSYVNYEGISQKMLHPLSHLDDCNFNHYALQLSCYMYIILRHNPRLKPGEMWLHHVIFHDEKDYNGDPIVKEVVPYKVPYLKNEVLDMIKYHKTLK